MEHFYIFDEDVVNYVIKELIRIILMDFTKLESNIELKIYKNAVKMSLRFIKDILENKSEGSIFVFLKNASLNKHGSSFPVFELAKCDENVFQKLIYVLAVSKTVFVNDDLDSDVINNEILDRFLDLKFDSFENNFEFESTLSFIMEYNGILLDSKNQVS